jgi:hypothetical protein
MDDHKPIYDDEEPILSIIQQIKEETLNPKTLSKEIRQRCVEFLTSEGYTEAQIAQILMRSEKTISRDLVDIRARNAITPDINLAKQIVGDMFQKAMVHHKHLMRLARSPEATNGEKTQSEFLAWRVLKEVVEKMQTLGYLPLKPQEIIEDIFHHVSDTNGERGIAEAKSMLDEIERAAKEAGTLDPETEEKIKALKRKIEVAEINQEVSKLTKKDDKPKDEKETKNEK